MEISSLSKKQLVGQMLCFAFLGTSFDEQLRAFVSEMEVGGIIYFARNIQSPAQVANLNQKLQQKSPFLCLSVLIKKGNGAAFN